jgi:hypothetical protein
MPMTTDKTQTPQPPLTCEVCLKEMPHDMIHTHEGPDYVHHFCGLECYRRWQERQEQEDGKKG